MTTRSADRVLIANRGEIALRVVRTVRDLGGTSILPYTPEDLLSPAAELADEAAIFLMKCKSPSFMVWSLTP